MTMTDAAVAAAQAAAARAVARAEAQEAIWAAQRATARLEDAGQLVVLHGQEAWLGPAREGFDERCRDLRAQLLSEAHELRMLALAIEGCV